MNKQENLKVITDKLNKEMEILLINAKTRLFKCSESYILNNPEVLYKFKSQKLEGIINKLEVLNPMNTLKRGYAIVKLDDKVVSDISRLKNDDKIAVELSDGVVISRVLEVNKKDGWYKKREYFWR